LNNPDTDSKTDPVARRRVVVGVVSVAIGVGAMLLLTLVQDRIRTLRQEQACRQGDASVCLRLEATYRAGKRVSRDDEVADEFRGVAIAIERRDCEAQDAHACFQLGVLLTESPPQLRDPVTASSAFTRACKSGLKRACGEPK
jgi:hypothetical protein